MVTAYLSLGSNIGERIEYLAQGVQELGKNKNILVTKISSIYETAPVGFVDQDNFLNIAIEIKTSLVPLELLEVIKKIEGTLKREKKIHWGPRTIDIDIITYGNEIMNNEFLEIPHKEALHRAFVLVPLLEITNDQFKISGQKIKEVLEKIPQNSDIIYTYQETLPF